MLLYARFLCAHSTNALYTWQDQIHMHHFVFNKRNNRVGMQVAFGVRYIERDISHRFGSDLAGYLTLHTSIHNISGGRSDGIYGILAPGRSRLLCGFGGPNASIRSFHTKGPPDARAYTSTSAGWMCKRLSWFLKCLWWNGVPCIKRGRRVFQRNCGIVLQPQVSLHLCRRTNCLWFVVRRHWHSRSCRIVGLHLRVSQHWKNVWRLDHSPGPCSPTKSGTDDWHGGILHRCVPNDRAP